MKTNDKMNNVFKKKFFFCTKNPFFYVFCLLVMFLFVVQIKSALYFWMCFFCCLCLEIYVSLFVRLVVCFVCVCLCMYCMYVCVCCFKHRFNYPSQLKLHENTHTNEKTYYCKQCNLTFNRQSSLYNHQKTHEKKPKYECQHCDQKFVDTVKCVSNDIKNKKCEKKGETLFLCHTFCLFVFNICFSCVSEWVSEVW